MDVQVKCYIGSMRRGKVEEWKRQATRFLNVPHVILECLPLRSVCYRCVHHFLQSATVG